MNEKTENALVSGTFKDARESVMSDKTAGYHELKMLAEKAGLPEDMAHLLVIACIRVAKREVKDEYLKQVKSMTYFVERA